MTTYRLLKQKEFSEYFTNMFNRSRFLILQTYPFVSTNFVKILNIRFLSSDVSKTTATTDQESYPW